MISNKIWYIKSYSYYCQTYIIVGTKAKVNSVLRGWIVHPQIWGCTIHPLKIWKDEGQLECKSLQKMRG